MKHAPNVIPVLTLAVVVASSGPLAGQETSTTPLAAFGALIVGTWESGDSRHEVTWGVGRLAVRTSSYFEVDGEWNLVSEGMWYWDPTAEAIRGVTVAVNMPVGLFEYTSRVSGRSIVHDLVTHGEMGGRYVERWAFQEDGYEWALEQGGQRLAGGRYRRAP